MTDVKPLPAAPSGPDGDTDIRILTEGDICDARCPAVAYVRVYMYRNGDKDNLASTLHFCGHHWHQHCEKFWTLALDGHCGIIDETHWLEATP